jgi:hypothetical protein
MGKILQMCELSACLSYEYHIREVLMLDPVQPLQQKRPGVAILGLFESKVPHVCVL